MLNRNSPFRFLLTLLLALTLPFCCCDFRSLLTGCLSCDWATPSKAQTIAIQSDGQAGQDHCTHNHCHGHAPKSDCDEGSTPGGPPENEHDCSCGKSAVKMLTVEKSTVELPAPMVVAILDWFGSSNLRPFDPFKGREVGLRLVERPQTSLVRMHCALIV